MPGRCILVLLCFSLIFFLFNDINEAIALTKGQKVPSFVLKNTDGKLVSTKLNQKSILGFVHFSSKKCKNILYFLNKLSKKDTRIVVVNIGPDKSGNLKRIVTKYQLNYDVVLDPTLKTTKAYKVLVLPTVFLVNSQGIVKKKIVGYDQNVANKIRAF